MSGFLSAKSCLTAGHTSPTSSTLGKRKQHPACKKAPVNVPQPAARVSGVPIRAHNAADSWAGRRVMVYWPADNQWWEATLCRVSAGLLVLTHMLAPLACSGTARSLQSWWRPLLEEQHQQALPPAGCEAV